MLSFINNLPIYTILFFAFLVFLAFLAVFSIYYLFFQFPKLQGKKNQEFVSEETQEFADEYKEALKEQFDKLSKLNIDFYIAASSDIRNKLIEEQEKSLDLIQNLSRDFQAEMQKTLESIKEGLSKENLNPYKILEQKLNAEYDSAVKQIESYKLARIEKLDRGIIKTLEVASLAAFGKVISLQEHKELIVKALEDAKKEGIFND